MPNLFLVAKMYEALAGLAFAMVVLAGCSTSSAPNTERPSKPEAVGETLVPASSTAPANSTRACPNVATDPVVDGKLVVANLADLTDTGTREYAAGRVTLNADGRLASYTVAPGDAIFGIADRLCVTPLWLDALNSVRRVSSFTGDGHGQVAIHAGDVLNLDPTTITSVGSENGEVMRNTPTIELPPQR